MQQAASTGILRVTDVVGNVTEQVVHPEWRGQQLCARAVDLKSAYKQLAISKKDLPLAVVGHWSSELERPVFWQSLALPFGSVASVYGFNQASRALEILLSLVGPIVCSSYFDDYPILDFECTTRSATVFTEACMKLLGWSFDEGGEKYKPFSRKLPLLG
eukprot:2671844-Amphidinium_carterae.1